MGQVLAVVLETRPLPTIYIKNRELVIEEYEQSLRNGEMTHFPDAFTIHRVRLWQIIHFRLSDQVRARVDADDVVQEVYLDAQKRLSHFASGDFPSFFLWLRLVAQQTLSRVHRRHLGTESRSTQRESGPIAGNAWGKTSACLSQRFVAHLTSPSQAAVKKELIGEVKDSLEMMNEMDREVVALRHFEELTNQEVAIELGISPKAASIRYMRALERLRNVLERI